MSTNREAFSLSIVRILDRGLRVVGTGFLVAPDLIATCAHVIQKALHEKDKTSTITGGEHIGIQFLSSVVEGQDIVSATVVGEYFRDKDAEDVAILRLAAPVAGIQPLALATSHGLVKGELEGFAFPEVDRNGLWMTATVVGLLDIPNVGRRLQVRSNDISPGCSGGPLWDERGRVVAMAVSIVDQEPKTGRHLYTAKVIPSEVIAKVCAELSLERVDRRAMPPGAEQCTAEWLASHNETAFKNLDTRYTPKRHIRTESERLLDAAALSPDFVDQYARVLRSATEAARNLRKLATRSMPSAATNTIKDVLTQIEKKLPLLGDGTKTPTMAFVLKTCAEWQHASVPAWNALRPPRKASESQTDSASKNSASNYGYELSLLERFLRAIDTLDKFAVRFFCADSRFFLVTGSAGSGKSHLLANFVQTASAKGQPSLLLLGEYFRSSDLPWKQLSERLALDSKALLFALNRAAELVDRPAMLCIDALNESDDRKLWLTGLWGLAASIKEFPHVRLVVSCRDDFAKLTLPPQLAERREQEWAYIEHDGFGGNTFEAVVSYFGGYGVQSPHFPPLIPEFQNPLFLRTFCEAFENSQVPDGPITLSTVMEARISKICDRLLRDIDCPEDMTRNAIDIVAELIEKSGSRPVPRQKLRTAVDSIFRNSGDSKSLYRHLHSNGLLVEIPQYGPPPTVAVRFPFERFSEYFIADRLLRQHTDFDTLQKAWSNDGTLARFREHGPQRLGAGLARALAILVPERYGREFLSLFPGWETDGNLISGFLASLAWRSPQSMGDETNHALSIAMRYFPERQVIEFLLSMATIPDHPYNAHFLHKCLKRMALPQRDLAWTVPASRVGQTDLIIRWSLQVPLAAISDEQALLAGRVLMWLCSSNHRALRFRATIAAIRLLTNRGHIAAMLVRDFADVDDPYVAERVFAIAAGVAMREHDRNGLQAIATAVFNSVFDHEYVPPNILLRDYAQCVLEIARERGALPAGVTAEKCRPPYRSKMPRIWSEKQVQALEKKHERWRKIIYSVQPDCKAGHYGDFGRYIMQSAVEQFWGVKIARQRSASQLTRAKVRNRDLSRREHSKFDAMVARRWVIQRVAELGWTPALFDNYEDRLPGGRMPPNIEQWREERIGKKYQWIALHELLGYLSDHYQLRETYSELKTFAGPWQLFGVRDFDPSRPLRDLELGDIEEDEESTPSAITSDEWSPLWKQKYPDPFADATLCAEPLKWVQTPPPDFIHIIQWQQTPTRDGEWLLLGGHFRWEEPKPFGNLRPRLGVLQRWADIRPWLVRKEHFKSTLQSVRQIQFSLVGVERVAIGDLWLGQYPWGAEFASVRKDCDEADPWVRDKSMPIVHAIVECNYGLIPAPQLLSILGARWAGIDLDFIDAKDEVVAFSPRMVEELPHKTLFVRRASLVSSLQSAGWEIIWAVTGDQICFDYDSERGGRFIANEEMKFSAVYWLEGGSLTGGLTRIDILPIPRR